MRPKLNGILVAMTLGIAAAAAGSDLAPHSSGAEDPILPHSAPSRSVEADAPIVAAGLPVSDNGVRKSDRLSSELDALHRADAAARASGRTLRLDTPGEVPAVVAAAMESGRLRIDSRNQVQVIVEVQGDAGASVVHLIAAGLDFEQIAPAYGLIQGHVAVGQLRDLTGVPGVISVRSPARAEVNVGSVTTQGDAILDANDLRSAYGVAGQEVRVGVISDGLEGLAASQATGDLPPGVNHTTCNAVPQSATATGAGAEGTAMLEIVHDLAPAAELWFGHWGFGFTGTEVDFMEAVNCLALNTDVVVDDIGFFNLGLYDGTSNVSQNAANALNAPGNRIRGYYTAVGNSAQSHYQEAYVDSGFFVGDIATDWWELHRYQASASTTDAGFGLACAPGVYCGDEFQLAPGGIMVVRVQWNDPWSASSNDYDLLLADEFDGQIFLASANIQDGNDHPTEFFVVQNNHGVTANFDILIGNYTDLASARTFDLFVNCFQCATYPGGPIHNFNTISSSVSNNNDAGGGVMALGAINQADIGNDAIEAFSSRGPTNDARTKPDASALDGISVTGSGGFPTAFFGTSAAGPHAAGIAALLLSCKPVLKHGEIGDNPAVDRSNLRNALLNSAVDLGAAGIDNTFGSGRLDADAAAVAAACLTDVDGDGAPNGIDNCFNVPNAPQTNTDAAPLLNPPSPSDATVPLSDSSGDACDADDDNDGRADTAETAGAACAGLGAVITNPLLFDTDGDRIRDGVECLLNTNPNDALSRPPTIVPGESDNDGLSTAFEISIGSNPNDPDSDDDGVPDGLEYKAYGTSPVLLNSDDDTCNDDLEIASVNADTVANPIDLLLVAQNFNVTTKPVLDIDKNGTINTLDLFIIANNATINPC